MVVGDGSIGRHIVFVLCGAQGRLHSHYQIGVEWGWVYTSSVECSVFLG